MFFRNSDSYLDYLDRSDHFRTVNLLMNALTNNSLETDSKVCASKPLEIQTNITNSKFYSITSDERNLTITVLAPGFKVRRSLDDKNGINIKVSDNRLTINGLTTDPLASKLANKFIGSSEFNLDILFNFKDYELTTYNWVNDCVFEICFVKKEHEDNNRDITL